MKLYIDAGVAKRWRKAALKAFPNEVLGIMLGRINEDGIFWLGTHIPESQKANEWEVAIDDTDYIQSLEVGAEGGIYPIGTIHTHTFTDKRTVCDPTPSLGDIQNTRDWEIVVGIMNVYGPKVTGRKSKTCDKPCFFGKTTMLEAVEVEIEN